MAEKDVREDVQEILQLIISLVKEVKEERELNEEQQAKLNELEERLSGIAPEKIDLTELKKIAVELNELKAVSSGKFAELAERINSVEEQLKLAGKAEAPFKKEDFEAFISELKKISEEVAVERKTDAEMMRELKEKVGSKDFEKLLGEMHALEEQTKALNELLQKKTRAGKAGEIKEVGERVKELNLAFNKLFDKLQSSDSRFDLFALQTKNLAKNYVDLAKQLIELNSLIAKRPAVERKAGEELKVELTGLRSIEEKLAKEDAGIKEILEELKKKTSREELGLLADELKVIEESLKTVNEKVVSKQEIGKDLMQVNTRIASLNFNFDALLQRINLTGEEIDSFKEEVKELTKNYSALIERIACLEAVTRKARAKGIEVKGFEGITEMRLKLSALEEQLGKESMVWTRVVDSLKEKTGKQEFNELIKEINELRKEIVLKKKSAGRKMPAVDLSSVKESVNELNQRIVDGLKQESLQISGLQEKQAGLINNYNSLFNELIELEKIVKEKPETSKEALADLAALKSEMDLMQEHLLKELEASNELRKELKEKASKQDIELIERELTGLEKMVESIHEKEMPKEELEKKLGGVNERINGLNAGLAGLNQKSLEDGVRHDLFGKQTKNLAMAYGNLVQELLSLEAGIKERPETSTKTMQLLQENRKEIDLVEKQLSLLLKSSKELVEGLKEKAGVKELTNLSGLMNALEKELMKLSGKTADRVELEKGLGSLMNRMNLLRNDLARALTDLSESKASTAAYGLQAKNLASNYLRLMQALIELDKSIRGQAVVSEEALQAINYLKGQGKKLEEDLKFSASELSQAIIELKEKAGRKELSELTKKFSGLQKSLNAMSKKVAGKKNVEEGLGKTARQINELSNALQALVKKAGQEEIDLAGYAEQTTLLARQLVELNKAFNELKGLAVSGGLKEEKTGVLIQGISAGLSALEKFFLSERELNEKYRLQAVSEKQDLEVEIRRLEELMQHPVDLPEIKKLSAKVNGLFGRISALEPSILMAQKLYSDLNLVNKKLSDLKSRLEKESIESKQLTELIDGMKALHDEVSGLKDRTHKELNEVKASIGNIVSHNELKDIRKKVTGIKSGFADFSNKINLAGLKMDSFGKKTAELAVSYSALQARLLELDHLMRQQTKTPQALKRVLEETRKELAGFEERIVRESDSTKAYRVWVEQKRHDLEVKVQCLAEEMASKKTLSELKDLNARISRLEKEITGLEPGIHRVDDLLVDLEWLKHSTNEIIAGLKEPVKSKELEKIVREINLINERLGTLTELSLEEKNIENELIEVIERLSSQSKALNELIEKVQVEGKSIDDFKEQSFSLAKAYHELEGRVIGLEGVITKALKQKPSKGLEGLRKELKGIEKQLLAESSIVKAFKKGVKKDEVLIESELHGIKEVLREMPKKIDLDSLKDKMKGLELRITEKVKGEKAEKLLSEVAVLHEEIEEVKKFEKETQKPLKAFPQAKPVAKGLTIRELAEELKQAELIGEKIDAERISGMIEAREQELAELIAEGVEKEKGRMARKLAERIDFEKIYKRLVQERKEKRELALEKARVGAKLGAVKPVLTKTEEKQVIESELIAQGIEAEEIGEKIDVERIWQAIKKHEMREKKLLHEKIKKAALKAKKEVRLLPEERKAELRLREPLMPAVEERKSFLQQLKEALFRRKK